MNSFGPQSQAMDQGFQQGNQQTGGITPNASQPQGAPAKHALLCAQLKNIVDALNQSASMLNQEAGMTALANDLYKASYTTNKVCEDLEKGNQ